MNNNFVSKSVRISNFQMAVKTKPSHGLGWKLEKWRDNWLRPIWPFIKKNQKNITTWSNLQLKIGNFVKLVILHGKLLKIGITKNEIPTSLGFSCSSPIRIILNLFSQLILRVAMVTNVNVLFLHFFSAEKACLRFWP